MTVIISIKNNERGTVIRDKDNNSNRSDKSDNDVREEERNVGGGVSHRHTLTHSLNLSQIPSLTINNFTIFNVNMTIYIIVTQINNNTISSKTYFSDIIIIKFFITLRLY